jgi:hypothetical protein
VIALGIEQFSQPLIVNFQFELFIKTVGNFILNSSPQVAFVVAGHSFLNAHAQRRGQ